MWREEDLRRRNNFRLVYMQTFRSEWLPSREEKEEKNDGLSQLNARLPPFCSFLSPVLGSSERRYSLHGVRSSYLSARKILALEAKYNFLHVN